MIFNPGFNIEPTTNPMGFVYGRSEERRVGKECL